MKKISEGVWHLMGLMVTGTVMGIGFSLGMKLFGMVMQ